MNVKREMTYFLASGMTGWADNGLFQIVYKDGHTLDFQPYDSKDNISCLRVSYYTDPEDAVYYDLRAEDDNLKELVSFRSTLYQYLEQYSEGHDLLVSLRYQIRPGIKKTSGSEPEVFLHLLQSFRDSRSEP